MTPINAMRARGDNCTLTRSPERPSPDVPLDQVMGDLPALHVRGATTHLVDHDITPGVRTAGDGHVLRSGSTGTMTGP